MAIKENVEGLDHHVRSTIDKVQTQAGLRTRDGEKQVGLLIQGLNLLKFPNIVVPFFLKGD